MLRLSGRDWTTFLGRGTIRPIMVRGLIGRQREIGIVNDLIRDAKSQGGVLVVTGEAGIGKSRLLTVASDRATEHGMTRLTTTGLQSETHLPFAGLHMLLHPILAGADELPAPQRAALLSAFGMTDEAAPDRFLIGLAALTLLGDAGTHTPMLILVEDAQWLDRPTCDVLTFVARRLEAESITMLIAIREGYESPFFEAALPQLHLDRLDGVSAGALLDAGSPGLANVARQRLLDEAAGNPLALVELPAALGPEGTTSESTLPAQLPLTDRLERTFAARVRELPAVVRGVVLVAALDDQGNLGEVLKAASVLDGANHSVDALEPALSAQLIEVDGTELRFRHPLVRSAVRQTASVSEHHDVHSALAQVLADQPDRRAWHRAASIMEPDEDVASELEAAAVRAQTRGALPTAVAALERAAVLSDDPGRRGSRALRAAEIAIDLGRQDLVAPMVLMVEPIELSPIDQGRRAWVREVAHPSPLGDPAVLRSLVEIADRVSEAGDVDLALRLLWAAANSGFWAGRDDVTSTLVVESAERVAVERNDPRLLSVLAYAASIDRGGVVIQGVSAHAPDRADPLSMNLLGNAAATVGAFDVSEPFITASIAGLREQGRLALLAQVLVLRAWAEIHLGRWDLSLSDAEEAVRLSDETGQPIWGTGAKVALSILAGLRGDEAEAETFALAVESVALPSGARAVMCVVQMARGLTALSAGRHDDAYEHLRRIFDSSDPAHHPMESCWAIGNLAEAAVHSGRRDEAREIMRGLEPIAKRTPSPWFHVAMRHARSLLATDAEAEALFQTALDADLVRWPFDRARILLAYGAWLRRQRRIGESRVPLRAAREAFDALGATAWGTRARSELRASGESSLERAPAARDLLSAQELQIAQMAAEGLTNREIGQRLYLSHRTVGSHLYRVFPKLGITSRTQLRSALDQGTVATA